MELKHDMRETLTKSNTYNQNPPQSTSENLKFTPGKYFSKLTVFVN